MPIQILVISVLPIKIGMEIVLLKIGKHTTL